MSRIDYFEDPTAPTADTVVPGATAVVRDDADRLLMIQRADTGRWALPGGSHELGGYISDTVVREVYEETGIEVEVTGLFGVYTNPRHVMAIDGEVRQHSRSPSPPARSAAS